MDQFLKVMGGIFKHLVRQLCDIWQEGLPIEGFDAKFMEHKVVGGCVRKTKEDLLLGHLGQGILVKEMRRQAISIIPTDGT